jgi:hypothetical protein
MKKIIYLIVFSFTVLTSCDLDDYLNKTPLDSITDVDYWKSASDLQLYVNQFYTMLPQFPSWGGGYLWEDNNSDNMASRFYDNRLAGTNTITTNNGSWDYSRIRSINIMLNKYKEMSVSESEIAPYVGEAYFFRAFAYFNLVRQYGDVPYVSQVLTPDSDELFAARTPRKEVIDYILDDLSQAIEKLPPKAAATRNRINKESALLYKSRVALYEGTWEKYHQETVFGVKGSNGQEYLEIAASAAKQLMDMNTIELYSTGNPEVDYASLFNRDDLSGISEVLLSRDYNTSLGTVHNLQRYTTGGSGTGLTKSLIESYLCEDGKPISLSPLYRGDKSLEMVVENRDPRLRQMIYWKEGEPRRTQNGVPVPGYEFTRPYIDQGGESGNTTGYMLKKGLDTESRGQLEHNASETSMPIFRYAEALLNYAEAKAELGSITQNDIDLTINKIRLRAGMPTLNLHSIMIDPNWQFPELSPIINEVRRERRVELACEGYRADDLFRWRAHHLIVGKRPLGYWFDKDFWTGVQDSEDNYVDGGPLLIPGKDIFVNEDGYLDPYQKNLPNGFGFKPDRDYLYPVPPAQISLNGELTQNPGWE